jgi:hypothetical protein
MLIAASQTSTATRPHHNQATTQLPPKRVQMHLHLNEQRHMTALQVASIDKSGGHKNKNTNNNNDEDDYMIDNNHNNKHDDNNNGNNTNNDNNNHNKHHIVASVAAEAAASTPKLATRAWMGKLSCT